MAKRRTNLSAQLRAEIRRLNKLPKPATITRYRIAVDADLEQSTLSRFMAGQTPSVATLEALLDYLGWTVGPAKRRAKR